MLSKSKKRLVERLKRPRLRRRERLVLVEGPRVVAEALRSDVVIRDLWMEASVELASTGRSIAAAAAERGTEVAVVADGALRAVSDTESPQAVLAIVEEPAWAAADRRGGGRILLLDGLQDPGNVGTLIRTAWALGLTEVWISRGSVDPWGSKAVRASAGAVFHVTLVRPEAGVDALTSLGLPVWVADPSGTPVNQLTRAGRSDWVLAVGNEGSGVSDAVASLGSGVSIPMARGADSLNVAVAGSILMYVLAQAGRDGDR